MKKSLKKLIVTLAAVSICAQGAGVYAFEVQDSAGNITVTGTSENQYVNVIIMPVGEVVEDLTSEMLTDSRHVAFSVAGGTIEEHFGLPADFAAGEYKAIFFDSPDVSEARFMHYNAQLDALSDAFKEADEAGKQELIQTNAAALGIAEEDAALFASIVSGLGDLKDVYGEAMTVLRIKQGGLEDAVTYYGGIYGMDSEEYTALKDAVQETLQEKLSEAAITDLEEDYQKYLKESMFDELQDAEDLYALLAKLGADFTTYNKLSDNNKNSVLTRMMNNLPETVDDLDVSVFEQYASDAYSSQIAGGGGSPGGSSRPGSSNSSNGPSAGQIVIDNNPIVQNEKPTFADIAEHWAKEYILQLYADGVVSGYNDGNFCPDNSITRAEFSTLIVKALDIGMEDVQDDVFTDVRADDWHASYVQALSRQGAVSGYDDGSFHPNDSIKRQDMAVILYNILNSYGADMSQTADFNDEALIGAYAQEAVSRLAGAGVISGSDGNFNPQDNLTRAEAVTVIIKLEDLIK